MIEGEALRPILSEECGHNKVWQECYCPEKEEGGDLEVHLFIMLITLHHVHHVRWKIYLLFRSSIPSSLL